MHYLMIWSGGYEPPSVYMTMSFDGVSAKFTEWTSGCDPTEDIIDVYLCTPAGVEFTLTQLQAEEKYDEEEDVTTYMLLPIPMN